jgi:serine O-acetyltransferase
MTGADWIDSMIAEVAEKLHTCNRCRLRRKSRKGEYVLPDRKAVHDVLDTFIGVLFPGCHGHGPAEHGKAGESIEEQLSSATRSLREQVTMAFEYQCELEDCDDCCDCEEKADKAVRYLVESLPDIQQVLQEDIQAAYDGDPAAKSTMEIVMSYPAIQAITAYRIAHALYEKDTPLIARIMTELAHSRTGIDIHPGATIGRRFFIDHGTGVVIGETSIIGDNVKIYQGVTLGAMSFPKDENGQPVKGMKRHPNVCSNVTIYAEATILGDVTIGEGSTIGGNVWLTYSVPPNSKVQNVEPGPKVTR